MEYSEFVRISNKRDWSRLLNKKNFLEALGDDAQFVEDNIRLDFFGQQLEDEYFYMSSELMRHIYIAAKLVFDRHPGATFIYDAANVYDMISSPYAVECETPEQWLMTYTRVFAEKQMGYKNKGEDSLKHENPNFGSFLQSSSS